MSPLLALLFCREDLQKWKVDQRPKGFVSEGGFCVWGGGMSTSGCDDDDGLGCESGGGGGGGDDGGGGGEGVFPDPGGDGEWFWELWSEDIMSSSGL